MPDVQVRVGAESVGGEEVYEAHAKGLSRISMGARQSILAFGDARKEMFQYRMGLMAINATLSTANMLIGMSGIKNEALRKVMIGLNAAVAIGNTLVLLRAAYESRAALATWARAIANVAASGFLAPALLAIMAAAVIGALALRSTAMAQGGYGLVSKPTLFLAGEAGPEAYSFAPLRGGGPFSAGGGSVNVRQINITVVTDDPRKVGQALTEEMRKLKEVLR
jgi:hypothetical protein